MTPPTVWLDSLSGMLGFQLRRAAAALRPALEAALEPLGLRTSEATVLIAVGDNPGRTQGEIGRDLRIKAANMAPLASGLAAAGLLTRTPGPGRAMVLTLTAEGERRLAAVRRVIEHQEARIAAGLSAADRARLLAALKDIADRACREALD